MNTSKILIVDDRPSNLKALRIRLTSSGYEVIEASNGPDALKRVETDHPDLILLDVMMPGMDGYEVCQRIKAYSENEFIPVILVTAKTETESIVKGLEIGADEYITKPFDSHELMARVKSMLRIRQMYQENTHLKREIQQTYRFDNLIGESPAMQAIYHLLEKIIQSTVTTLLTGETGTGKEAIARAIHYNGPRKNSRFVSTNCGALAEHLLESELFGHRKGAFTGAIEDHIGLFEAASEGTIFLDEIGDTTPSMQVKLLRVLQESEVTRVGETKPRPVDARIIAATNRDLEADVKEGTFREDLYYRLNVFPIHLPPLRERRSDIPLLAQHFLTKHTQRQNRIQTTITPETLTALTRHNWPGNVRELENEIERSLVLTSNGEAIALDVLSEKLRPEDAITSYRRDGALKDAVETVERDMIQNAFNRCNGNKTHMAKQLGITRWTLLQKLKTYNIPFEAK